MTGLAGQSRLSPARLLEWRASAVPSSDLSVSPSSLLQDFEKKVKFLVTKEKWTWAKRKLWA